MFGEIKYRNLGCPDVQKYAVEAFNKLHGDVAQTNLKL